VVTDEEDDVMLPIDESPDAELALLLDTTVPGWLLKDDEDDDPDVCLEMSLLSLDDSNSHRPLDDDDRLLDDSNCTSWLDEEAWEELPLLVPLEEIDEADSAVDALLLPNCENACEVAEEEALVDMNSSLPALEVDPASDEDAMPGALSLESVPDVPLDADDQAPCDEDPPELDKDVVIPELLSLEELHTDDDDVW
jgi:hypothetical protein